MATFDSDGDGRVTWLEFYSAVRPHLKLGLEKDDAADGVDIAEAVRTVVALRSQSRSQRSLRAVAAFVSSHRIILFWLGWIAVGAAWGVMTEGWDVITGVYFAVASLSTGGLQAPSLRADGVLPPFSALFVSFFCMTGIPLFGFALGKFANVFVGKQIAEREKRALSRPISASEYAFAERLFSSDDEIDLPEFLALSLLRLGKVDMTTLELLKSEFERRDADGDGKLSRTEAIKTGYWQGQSGNHRGSA